MTLTLSLRNECWVTEIKKKKTLKRLSHTNQFLIISTCHQLPAPVPLGFIIVENTKCPKLNYPARDQKDPASDLCKNVGRFSGNSAYLLSVAARTLVPREGKYPKEI